MIQQSFMDSSISASASASSSEAILASTAVVTELSSSYPELLPAVRDLVSIAFPAELAFELWLSSVEASLELKIWKV